MAMIYYLGMIDLHIMVHAINDHRLSITDAHVRIEIPELGIQQNSDTVDLGQSDHRHNSTWISHCTMQSQACIMSR